MPKFANNFFYCDGACSGNPGPGGWGLLIYDQDKEVILEQGGAEAATTNNRMELLAALRGLEYFAKQGRKSLFVYTDSKYLIDGATKWVFGWIKNNWKTSTGGDVMNQDLWKQIHACLKNHPASPNIKWVYVPGHQGVEGNERVDEIAVAFSQGEVPRLYEGPAEAYDLELKEFVASEKIKECYLSFVGGVLERHATWAACEARVKGKAGARFKKVKTKAEEEAFLAAIKSNPAKH